MQLKNTNRIYALILIASSLATILSITFGVFPHLGLSISFITFSLLAFYIKTDKTALTKVFFAITLILSLSLSIRSEASITFLNLIAIFYFGSLFALTKKDGPENAFSILFAPFIFLLNSFNTASLYRLNFKDFFSEDKKRENILNTVAVSLITLAVLAVILPLLSSANPLFKKMITSLVDLLGLGNLKLTEDLFKWIVRLVFFSGLAYLTPKMATFVNKKESISIFKPIGLNLLIPKIAVAVVLIIFFIAQFQLYFSSRETLSDLGYTYSQYTNEVFAQLSIVAGIVLALLYGDAVKKKINNEAPHDLTVGESSPSASSGAESLRSKTSSRSSTSLRSGYFAKGDKMALALIVEGIFLTFMAYKSVYEYSSAWGFTYKRLYGFTVATWILGIFVIYSYTFLKNIQGKIFLIKSAVYTGIILILINIANFDFLIYRFRRATTESGVDYHYLSRLSSDSLSYKAQLDRMVKYTPDPVGLPDKIQAEEDGIRILLYKIEYLQNKYKHPDIRGFNLLEYLQYRQVKDVDTSSIRSKYIQADPL